MKKQIAWLSLALLLLTACTPSKIYAGNKKDGGFFTVPYGWNRITNDALNGEEGKSTNQSDLDRLSMVTYQEGFTPAKNVTPRDVFVLDPLKEPIVFARFRDLFPEERNAVSLNSLRNVVLPVTGYVDGTHTNDRHFLLLDDVEITQKGGRGVNLLYSFDNNGQNETINQISMYSNDLNKVYIFIVRCTTECYNKNQKEIDKIVKSFTVREVR
jgi:hypothetical protein